MSAGQQLTTSDVAARLGLAEATIRRYRREDRAEGFPEPDGMTGRTPWWRPSTVDRWARERPGNARRGRSS